MISNHLWQSNETLAKACLENPFVRGIATGSLKREKFAFYVGQDAFFLKAFARAYSIAAAKTSVWEDFCTFHRLADGVLEELRLHEGYASQWDVNLQNIKPAAATRRYMDFLLATAWGCDVGLTAVAMTPCMRLYAFLGQQLAQGGIPNHQYTDWIKTYSSQEFEELAQLLESLCDRYATNTQATRETYHYAILCEDAFFSAAWETSTINS
jgi:thiaminase/transcriptional activator TenA